VLLFFIYKDLKNKILKKNKKKQHTKKKKKTREREKVKVRVKSCLPVSLALKRSNRKG